MTIRRARWTKSLVLAATLAVCPNWALALTETCGQGRAGTKSFSHCFYQTPGSSNPDVVIYFHGQSQANSGNEKQWASASSFGNAVRARWAERGLAAPSVFAVSFGGTWFLGERDSVINVSLANFDAAVVEAARAAAGGFRGRVLALGDSMGGLNSFLFAMKSRVGIAKVASLCPVVADISPWASTAETEAFLRRNPETERSKLSTVMLMGRYSYANVEEWSREAPLPAVRTRTTPFPFAVHMSAGRQDPFGIFGGAKALTERLSAIGSPVEFVPLDQGHCALDPVRVADFLVGS